VPGVIEGTLAVFDAAARRPVCQVSVRAGGRAEIKATVTETRSPDGRTRQNESTASALRKAAASDLHFALTGALGAALALLAPNAELPVAFAR
jgi:hypothetical protein